MCSWSILMMYLIIWKALYNTVCHMYHVRFISSSEYDYKERICQKKMNSFLVLMLKLIIDRIYSYHSNIPLSSTFLRCLSVTVNLPNVSVLCRIFMLCLSSKLYKYWTFIPCGCLFNCWSLLRTLPPVHSHVHSIYMWLISKKSKNKVWLSMFGVQVHCKRACGTVQRPRFLADFVKDEFPWWWIDCRVLICNMFWPCVNTICWLVPE